MHKENHKILLIEPPFYRLFKDTYSLDRYPLSLGYLAGAIKEQTDWAVMAYNADFTPQSEEIKISYLTGVGFDIYLNNLRNRMGKIWKEIKSTIAEYTPTIVGISVKSQNFKSAYEVAKLVKEINEQTLVIMGGPYPSMAAEDILVHPEIDICVKGEGEITIIELLKAVQNQNNFGNIKGIVYRKNGNIVKNPSRELISDLDSLCFPHESAPEVLKDYNKYPKCAFRNIFAIRGCPYNCFYCGSREIWSQKVRTRSVSNIIDEIESLRNKGIRSVHFDDDTFGINRAYITNLCNAIIKYCPELQWSCELHLKLVNEEIVSLMRRAGCEAIQVGVESGNNYILKKIRKNFTIEEAFRACKIIKKYGIKLETFFMIGLPWETEDTLNDTMKAIKRIKSDYVIYSIFTPYPGTEAFKFCQQRRLINEGFDISLYNHKSPINCFCLNIPPKEFRILASKIEKVVDRINLLRKIERLFSLQTYWKIKRMGMIPSVRKSAELLMGK